MCNKSSHTEKIKHVSEGKYQVKRTNKVSLLLISIRGTRCISLFRNHRHFAVVNIVIHTEAGYYIPLRLGQKNNWLGSPACFCNDPQGPLKPSAKCPCQNGDNRFQEISDVYLCISDWISVANDRINVFILQIQYAVGNSRRG